MSPYSPIIYGITYSDTHVKGPSPGPRPKNGVGLPTPGLAVRKEAGVKTCQMEILSSLPGLYPLLKEAFLIIKGIVQEQQSMIHGILL